MIMENKTKTLFVDVATVCHDLGVSRAKGYQIIKDLNEQLKNQRRRSFAYLD